MSSLNATPLYSRQPKEEPPPVEDSPKEAPRSPSRSPLTQGEPYRGEEGEESHLSVGGSYRVDPKAYEDVSFAGPEADAEIGERDQESLEGSSFQDGEGRDLGVLAPGVGVPGGGPGVFKQRLSACALYRARCWPGDG